MLIATVRGVGWIYIGQISTSSCCIPTLNLCCAVKVTQNKKLEKNWKIEKMQIIFYKRSGDHYFHVMIETDWT